MIEPGVSGQICVSVKEFGEAMGGVQADIINASGQNMMIFFIIGIVVGFALASGFWYFKNQIDDRQRNEEEPE